MKSGAVTLSVRVWEGGNVPTLVLVHGFPDSQRIWEGVIAPLAGRYRVVTYDVRGAGESDAPSCLCDYRLDRLAQDLKAVTDAVCPDRPFHLVAHDWGSIQSWESVTEPALQARIASFTTVSGPCLDHVGCWMRRRLLRPTPKHLAQVVGQIMHSWYIWLFHLPWLMPLLWRRIIAKRWPQVLEALEGIESDNSATRVKDGYHAIHLYRANIFPRLFFPRPRSTQIPVQLIVPLRDKHVRPQLFEDLSDWVPQLRRRDVECGHWALLLKEPQRLAQYVSEFVDDIETGRENVALVTTRRAPG